MDHAKDKSVTGYPCALGGACPADRLFMPRPLLSTGQGRLLSVSRKNILISEAMAHSNRSMKMAGHQETSREATEHSPSLVPVPAADSG